MRMILCWYVNGASLGEARIRTELEAVCLQGKRKIGTESLRLQNRGDGLHVEEHLMATTLWLKGRRRAVGSAMYL